MWGRRRAAQSAREVPALRPGRSPVCAGGHRRPLDRRAEERRPARRVAQRGAGTGPRSHGAPVSDDAEAGGTPLELVHLRRDARTSLELAIVGLAPEPVIEALASATGMLEAVNGLPVD